MAEKKITKSQRFEDIKAMLLGEDVKYGTTIEIAEQFIDHEVELLSKKNSAERKPTADQLANKGFCDLIVAYLSTEVEGKTCTEVQRAIPEFADFNNQKVASLMRILLGEHRVTREVVKGKSLFSVA